MKKTVLLSIFCALQVGCLSAQLNGEYLVGTAQPPPFNKLATAVSELNKAGISGPVSLLLTDTLYQESYIKFGWVKGVDTLNTITLRPANGVHATVRDTGEYIFGIHRVSHLYFEGKSPNGTGSLTIASTQTASCLMTTNTTGTWLDDGGVQNFHINYCALSAAQPAFTTPAGHSWGIYIAGSCDGISITNNKFTGGDVSISIGTNTSAEHLGEIEISGNVFNKAGGVCLTNNGTGGLGYQDDNNWAVVQNNRFVNTNLGYIRSTLSIISIAGFYELVCSYNLLDGATCGSDLLRSNCRLFELIARNALIANNVAKNINFNTSFEPYPGIALQTYFSVFSLLGCDTVRFYHNSVCIPESKSQGFKAMESWMYGIDLNKNDYVDFKNNSIALLQGNQEGAGANSVARLFSFSSEADIQSLHSDHNTYYVANHNQNYFCGLRNSKQGLSFMEWQAEQPSRDVHSYWEMPKAISPNNLHLSEDCNRGTPLPLVPLDCDSIVRSTTAPDIGGYEYTNYTSITSSGNCTFTGTAFSLSNANPVNSYTWHFGDGTTSTKTNPSHTYSVPGTYKVSLAVRYQDGSQDTVRREVTVYGQPQKPMIAHE